MLPTAWVDDLFAKLSVRYGAEFARRYADVEPGAVKADWSDVLSGFTRDGLAYGLQNLPAKPPNATEFRDLCRRAPAAAAPAREHAHVPPDPARLQRMLARLAGLQRQRSGMTSAAYCAQRIRAIAQERGYMTESQRHVRNACERQTGLPPATEDDDAA